MLLAMIPMLGCSQEAPRTWPFTPPIDEFSNQSLLDLRYLNEKTAGETGFVSVDSAGDFRLGNGKPARFWAINSGVSREKPWQKRPLGRDTEPDLARAARFYAKRGVNLVRLHSHVDPKENQKPTEINQAERDWIWRSVAANKKEGIYTVVSPYWGVPAKITEAWGVPGGAQNALGLLFFDPKFRGYYKGWLRQLLAEKNPYTGIPLAQDPALAIFQIQNEDSLLFWTVDNIKGPQRENLERLYQAFLTRKYKTARPAQKLLPIWEATQVREGAARQALQDQIEFYSRTMYDFNADIAKFCRQELGMKQLINAGNWRTANTARLNDAERWSYTANEVDAVNRYFGGLHKGPNEGWAIQNDDLYTDKTATLAPLDLPVTLKQTAGRPIMVTESSWVMPNFKRAEGPWLIATYSALTGVDAFFWFATGDDGFTPPESANGYNPSQAKWVLGDPDQLGTFPAAALLYRTGLVKRGAPAVTEYRPLNAVFDRQVPLIAEESGFDPNRDSFVPLNSGITTAVDPLAFLVGPVVVHFSADPTQGNPAQSKDLSRGFIDRANGVVKSNTQELSLDYQSGLATLDAPAAQGATGRLNARPIKLSKLQLRSTNPFGSVLAVAMDGKPLGESQKILIQVGTVSRPTGWKDIPADVEKQPGFKITNYGKAPWAVDSADLTILLSNPTAKQVTILDANGMPVSKVTPTRKGSQLEFKFPSNAMYVIVS